MTFSKTKLFFPVSGANSKGRERKGRQPGKSGARPRAHLGALPSAGPREQRPRQRGNTGQRSGARRLRAEPVPHAGPGGTGLGRAPRRPHVRPTAASVVPRAAAELPGSQRVPEPRQQELRDGGRRRCRRSVQSRPEPGERSSHGPPPAAAAPPPSVLSRPGPQGEGRLLPAGRGASPSGDAGAAARARDVTMDSRFK